MGPPGRDSAIARPDARPSTPRIRVRLRTKILIPVTAFILVIVGVLAATALQAREDVQVQVEERVQSIAEIFGQFFATSVLAGQDADYERIQNVIDSIQAEDEAKRFFAFILVEGGESTVGAVNPSLLSDRYAALVEEVERSRGTFRARTEEANRTEREREAALAAAADANARRTVEERFAGRISETRRAARDELMSLNAAREKLFRDILVDPAATPGLRIYRAMIHDCRPAACDPAAYDETRQATVLVGISWAPFVRERWRSLLLLASVTGLGLVFGGGGAWWIAGKVTRPVNALVAAMRDVDAGVYDRRVEPSSDDEIGVLALSFNRMTAGLAERERLRAEGERLRRTTRVLASTAARLEEEKEAISEALQGLASMQVARRFLRERNDLDFTGKVQEATVLFADIRGFTSMCERLGPDEIFSMLNDYFGRMRAVADRYDGCILKFMGDALMISFNVPERQSHHALRAVYTGIDVQREILRMNKDREAAGREPINVGIGVNTGTLMVGNVGSKARFDYTVIGDAVNTAQRIESIAPAGHLFISESCYRQVSDHVEAVAREPVVLKGKEHAVQIYAVVRRTRNVVDFGGEASS